MIELKDDELSFSFPEVHAEAKMKINFQRTLRIPDDDKTYPLPPGLGRFPLRHIDDFPERVPADWLRRGGVMLPMYQSEALWLNFDADYGGPGHGHGHGHGDWERDSAYPFAIKIAAGKINAVTGDGWTEDLAEVSRGEDQDYLVRPRQPWLDGYAIEKGVIRQFVAMPLGSGYSAEEQITGKPEFGGIQIAVSPMKADVFERRFPKRKRPRHVVEENVCYSMTFDEAPAGAAMGLAPGGRMKQEIYDDPFDSSDWDRDRGSRCFVHLANSLVWRAITDAEPPTTPPTSAEYERYGLPWFDYYDENARALKGSKTLAQLKTVLGLGKERGEVPLPENESVEPKQVVELRAGLGKDEVRPGRW